MNIEHLEMLCKTLANIHSVLASISIDLQKLEDRVKKIEEK